MTTPPAGSASAMPATADEDRNPKSQGGNIPEPPKIPPVALEPSSKRKGGPKPKVFRVFRSVFRSFPIFSTPACHFSGTIPRMSGGDGRIHGARRMTGTLFGHRKGRITIAIQENSRSVPVLLLELGIPTAKFMQDMGSGLLRIALECEKKPDKSKLIDEPLWTAFSNGKKIGYATKREPTSTDLKIMQLLHAVSMGAGVLPPDMSDPNDGELTYMRAHFDRVINSKDSETFYMLNPDGNSGPELSVFFVRI